MSSPVVHSAALITCLHQGLAQPTVLSPRVLAGGNPVVTLATPYAIAGCALASTSTPPCVSAQWVSGATRVLAGGLPVVVESGQALCAPTGQGLRVSTNQIRVFAS